MLLMKKNSTFAVHNFLPARRSLQTSSC